jgi:hypothetical protein
MAKLKSFEAELTYAEDCYYDLAIKDRQGRPYAGDGFCGAQFRHLAPALTKGIRKGKSAKVKLTQTKKGIKLERI